MTPEELLALMKSKGFESMDDLPKLMAALEAKTTDLDKYKAKASTVTGLEAQLKELQDAQTAREDLDKTELQKLNDKITKMEGEATLSAAATLKATRSALLERGIAEQIAGIPEKLRPFASEHLRTILPGREWADAEALKETITATLGGFNELLPEEMRVVKSGETSLPRTQNGVQPAGEKPVFDLHAALHPEG